MMMFCLVTEDANESRFNVVMPRVGKRLIRILII